MTTMLEPAVLTAAQVKQFHEEGYLGPFTLCAPDEMARLRAEIDARVLPTAGPSGRKNAASDARQSRHLDSRVIWEIASHPAIVDRMKAIYGPDLILWRTHMFAKEPGGKEIPWHQDLNYWPIEPAVNITAWVAIDQTTEENGCVQFIPGSHKVCLPTVKSPPEMEFSVMTDPKSFDVSKAVSICMQPGEFVLFNEKTLHHSHQNRSNSRRMGLAVRVTIPIVRVDHDALFPGHRNLILCGEDRMGFNQIGTPPVA